MKDMKKWIRGALGVAACAGLAALLTPFAADGPSGPARPLAAASTAQAPAPGTMYGQSLPANAWLAPPGGAPAGMSPLSTMSPPRFAADSRGKLVLDSETHANIEKLLLEEDPGKMQATLDRLAKALPAQAASDLKVLVARFQQYSKALPHTIPPGQAPETEQESLRMLDSLHALRVSYLGPEATQAMFGAEEATARQLIALMALENDPHLTPQEKADRAQEKLRQQSQSALPAG